MGELEHQIYDHMVNLIRDQRHDFLNHLQVIMGNLQLDRREQAMNYLRQITSDIMEIGIVTKLENSYLSIFLLLAIQKSKNLGIPLSLNVESNAGACKNYKKESVDFLYLILSTALDYVGKLKHDENWLKVTYKEQPEVSVWELAMAPILAYGGLYRSLKKKYEFFPKACGSFSIHQPPGQTVLSLTIPKE